MDSLIHHAEHGSLRIHRILLRTHVEGPGERACIWVQGCSVHCPGCAVPWTWSTSGGEERSVVSLCEAILSEPGLEGVTFLGGEPFDQPEPLAAIARHLRQRGLGVVTFTGYSFERLSHGERTGWRELLSETDLLIDGPYDHSLQDLSRPWVGSTNKRYHFLTKRYGEADIQPRTVKNKVEIRIQTDGLVRLNGMLSNASLLNIKADLCGDHAK